jgi:hypothetical protein
MKRQTRPRVPRRSVHELTTRTLAEVAGGMDTSLMGDPYEQLAAVALRYDPYRKFKFLVKWSG